MIDFQVSLNFESSEKNTENMMSHLYSKKEGDYSEENTYDNEVFRSTIVHHRNPIYYIQY